MLSPAMNTKVQEFQNNNSAILPGADNSLCCFSDALSNFDSFAFTQASEILWTFCPPVILLFGTFGNVMTIVIIRRMSERQSSHSMFLYFTALAVSDLVILYIGLLRKWMVHVFDFDVILIHNLLCKLKFFLINVCGTTSAWLIVSMTMQRVMSVVWPHNKSLSCTARKVGFVISAIVIVITALNCYRLHAFAIMHALNATEVLCTNIDDEALKYFDWYVYPYIDLIVTSLAPFSMLIVGNSVLVWKVIQSVQVARVMTAGSGDQVNSRQKKASSLTVTLITVSLAFLFLTAPVCAYMILDPNVGVESAVSLSVLKVVWAICDLLWYVNSAINFYLYCLSGARFRGEVKRLFCKENTSFKMSTTSVSMIPDTHLVSKSKNYDDQSAGEF